MSNHLVDNCHNKQIAAIKADILFLFLQIPQLNFSGPEFVFAKFWEVLKKHLAANLILKGIWVRGWVKMAPGKARVSAPGRVRERDAYLVR